MIYPEINFKTRVQVINDNQIAQIHCATLEVLERTGVQMANPKALELLDGAGTRVIGNWVRFPAWMVEDAIQKAPPRVVRARLVRPGIPFIYGVFATVKDVNHLIKKGSSDSIIPHLPISHVPVFCDSYP